jgi:radical SAM superfamily enzyme YgiQ (UPF0313 family)
MPDVLLVQPPIRDFYLTAKRTIPYGLASIAAALEARGFSVVILDALATSKSRPAALPPELADLPALYGRPDISPFALFHRFRHFGRGFDHIARRAREVRAPVAGISSLFTPYAAEALAAAEAVKRGHPGCTTVLGGHHPTALPASALASPAVDFIVRGEGEAAMPELVRRLLAGEDPAGVPGVGFRRPGGGLHVSPPAVLAAGADFPLPAFAHIDRRHYRRAGGGGAVVVASRGCPLSCSYCCVGGAGWLPYRRRPVAQVLAEIEAAVAHLDAGFIDFEDENLAFDRGWFMALLAGITARFGEGALELRAMNGLFPPTLDPEVVAAMRRAGFRTLNLSLGTTCPEQLARFRRPDVRAAFDAALAAAAHAGMGAVGAIIVGAPFQRPEDSVADLLFLAARRVLAGVSVFYPAPGSREYERCRTLGLLPESLARLRATALPLDHTTRPEESATLLRLGRIVNFMKHLVDRGIDPGAAPPEDDPARDPASRRLAAGRRLLAAFLADGRIRGMTPEGELFEHRASRPLVERFIGGLRTIRVRGLAR